MSPRQALLRCARPAGLALAFVGPAAAQQPVEAPRGFQRILWCADAARAAVARDLGFTAVQLGRGGDHEALQRLGLAYYLDQPIGKGLLELRDEEWRPLPQAYERTRDPSLLVRPQCFATPGLVAESAAAAAAEAARVHGPGLLFVALADEASATHNDAPLDTCRCQHCVAAFREFAQRRLGSIDRINEVLGTHCASIEAVAPPTTDQVRRRELGDVELPKDLRPFGLRQAFADEQFAAAVRTIAGKVQAAVPGVPVGLTGLQVPAAFGGNDYALFVPALSLAEPYAIGGAVELARCLLPKSAQRCATLFPPDADSPEASVPVASLVRARLAEMAAEGLTAVVVWNDGTVAGGDGAPTAFGRAVRDALDGLQPVLDACAGAEVQTDPVWVVESQPSVRVWWMLDSAPDGMTWIRRLSSYEARNSTSQAARLGWIRLLQDLGVEPRFVADADLPERLLTERPRCLVVPAAAALDSRSVQAIGTFVRNGGTLLGDHSAALYESDLQRRGAGALDGLFGITERSFAWADLLVRQGRSTSRERGLPLAEKGLRGRLGERRADGDAFLEQAVDRGRAVYLNAPVCEYDRWRLDEGLVEPARELRRRVRAVLQQAGVRPPFEVRGEGLPTCLQRTVLRLRDGRTVLVLRIRALEAPPLLQRLAGAGPRAVQIELPRSMELRHLGGEQIGEGVRFDLRLDPFGALFLEVVR
jgi:hypothetical protein